MGAVCSHLAQLRGRSPFVWFFLGSFLGIFSLIILLALPTKKQVALQTVPRHSPSPAKIFNEPTVPHTQKDHQLWYFADVNRNIFGPMSFDLLQKEYFKKQIEEDTYLWNDKWETWKLLKEVPDFHASLRKGNDVTKKP